MSIRHTYPPTAASTIFPAGLASARPAATAVATGTHYYATGTRTIWRSDGAAWTAVKTEPQYLAAGSPSGTFRENYERGAISSATLSPAAGTLYVQGIGLYAGDVITNAHFLSGTTAYTRGTTAGTGHIFGVLLDASKSLMAYSLDEADTSAWTASAWKAFNFVRDSTGATIASTTIATSGWYYAGFMVDMGAGGSPVQNTMSGRGSLTSQAAGGDTGMKQLSASKTTFTYPPSAGVVTLANQPNAYFYSYVN